MNSYKRWKTTLVGAAENAAENAKQKEKSAKQKEERKENPKNAAPKSAGGAAENKSTILSITQFQIFFKK